MSELYENIENAIVSYLIQYAEPWPQSLKNSAAQLRIFAGESDQTKDGQAIIVIAEDSNQEEPQFTGNQHVPVQIWLRTPVTVLTAQQIQNKALTSLQIHQAASAILSDALNQDAFALAAYFNASTQNCTVMGGVMDLKPMRAEPPNFHASGWSFRLYAMNRVAP